MDTHISHFKQQIQKCENALNHRKKWIIVGQWYVNVIAQFFLRRINIFS